MKEDLRGAESKLFLKKWFNIPALHKVRFPKSYRIKELDFQFRKSRTIHEAKLLAKAKEAGVRTPIIFEIDISNTTLVLEYIDGEILKTLLPKISKKEIQEICEQLGEDIGKLHNARIIHGDLTTSNIIKSPNEKQLAFVDFGLGYISDRLEDFGIDLFLLERAFRNTHSAIFVDAWKIVIKGYKKTSVNSKDIENKLLEISSRGRYSERM
ncbi:MAG: Kae1-associated serine/threonine protein kinase [Candidatus Heimdallarchaeota archaeon]|nr:Kae1-associated serine/threonine protein kinase [Candidatus Heimdallarchaeota archaeon]MCK5183402.1 Kae1-associated serine/threonine protein kinase [Candidatus Heimdallarchaeota archaeon]